MPPKLPDEVRTSVRERALFLCEYCHTDERWQMVQFTVDHIIPISVGGDNGLENLALACFHCNRRKSDRVSVVDPSTGVEVPIFNPRQMKWNDHFCWSPDDLSVVPLSITGKITIEFLRLNRDRVLQIRQDDKLVHRHPPVGDVVAKA